MKKYRTILMRSGKLLSVFISAMLISAPSVLSVKAANDAGICTYYGEISASESFSASRRRFSDRESAAEYIRSRLKDRTYEFAFTIPKDICTDHEKTPLELLALALAETGNGSEGDYIRYALKGYKYGCSEYQSETAIYYRVSYYTSKQDEDEADREISRIMQQLDLNGMTGYEKIRAVYDCVSGMVNYAKNTDDLSVFSAYGAAVKGTAVCQGYSQLLYRMMNDAGIPCRIISGLSKGNRHTWNIVSYNGLWYVMDVTWDSQLGGSDGFYFMRGTSDFDDFSKEEKHIPIYEYKIIFPDYDSEDFKAAYPISEKKAEAPVYTSGDVNGNGIIDGIDASIVLTAYSIASVKGTSPLTSAQSEAADVTKDGVVDGKDASRILSYYAAASAGNSKNLFA